MRDGRRQRVLVTGATGFVGRELCAELHRRNYRVRAVVHRNSNASELLPDADSIETVDLAGEPPWSRLLAGVEIVMHLAARVHVLRESSRRPWDEFLQVNVEATRRLAEAAAVRVRRLVFVSSVHAVACTSPSTLDESSPCRPTSLYGRSKLLAEQALHQVAQRRSLETVVLRPAPVYGPDHRGNLRLLFHFALAGWPLPLGRLQNRRSFLYVKNLVDALITCADSGNTVNETFLLSDGEDLSTPELLRRLAKASGRPTRIVRTPLMPLRWGGWMTDRTQAVERLLGSLAIDSTKFRQRLAWSPPYTLDAGLAATAEWHLRRANPDNQRSAA